MGRFSEFLQLAGAELPAPCFARWASVFFTLSVSTYLLSLAASQAFLAVAGICYAAHLLHDKPAIVFPPVKLPLILFCLLTVLSVVHATSPTPGWLAVRKLVLFLILLLAVNLIVSVAHLELIFHVLFVESAVAGLVGAAQFISRYRATRIAHPHEIYRFMAFQERIQGFMGHWMNFGGQQMLMLAAMLGFVFLGPPRKKLWWLTLAVVAASVVLSLTRGVWLGSLAAGLYILACWRPRWLLGIPIFVALAYLVSPYLLRERVKMALHPKVDPALSIRLEMWQVGLRMMRAHLWLGVGPDDIERDYALYLPRGKSPELGYHGHLHDNFLQLGAERGVPALAAWVWFMGALGWHVFRVGRRLKQGRSVAHAALAGWLALIVEGCFEFNFGTSPVLMLFLFLAASPFIVERLKHGETLRTADHMDRPAVAG